MRQIFVSTLFVLFSTALFAQDGWDNWKPYSSESYYDVKKESSEKVESESYDIYNPQFCVTRMQNRFLSVDRFAHKYPSMSPYQYAANNPVIFIDINGDSLEIVGDENQRQLALEAIRQGLPPEVRDAVKLMEINGKFFVSDIILNEAKGLTKSHEFLALRQIVNSPGMAQLQMADENLQFQYFDKSIGQSVTTSFGQLGEAFQGITFTTDIANTIYDRTNIVSNVPGVNQSFVRSSMSMENIVQLTAHELYGHVHPQLMGQRASHYRVGDSFDQKIKQIMQRALQNYRRR